jgi:hypothetical protein
MRNLKKLLAVIMAVAMLASIMVPALAADYDDDAQKLYNLGLFKGTSADSYQPDLDDTLIRETGLALMIRAAGLEDEVLAMSTAEVNEQLAKVVDADEIADWAKPYVAYAVKNNLTAGIDKNILPNIKFGAKLPLTGKEFITFMLKAMGYPEVAWEEVLTKAAEVGMLTAGEAVNFGSIDVLTRDGAVGIMAGSMGGTTAAGITLAQALVEAGVVTEEAMVEAGYMDPLPTPEPTPVPKFELDSIVADNLKVIKINVTRPVDKDTVNKSNVKVLKDSTNLIKNDSDVKVSEDLQTLYAIVGETVNQNQKVKVALKDVKDTGGEKIEESETEVYMQDLTVPEIISFAANDAKTLEIGFSEPINYVHIYDTNLSNIKIDDKAVIGKTSFDYIKNTMTISLVNKLAEGTHKISIKDMKDYSGLVAIAKDFDFEIVKDETPPEIVSAKFVSTTQVDVEFNETIPDNKLGSFKVNGKDVTNKTKDGTKKIKLSGGFTLDMGALVEIKIEYKDQEDVVGNKVANWQTYTFNIEDDTTLPDVSLEVKSDGKLKFNFTKAMNTAKGKITIKKKSDNSVVQTVTAPFTGISEWKDKDKNREVEITFNNLKNKDAADYIAVLEEFEDATVRKNGMGKKEIEFAGKDTKAPEVFGYAKIAAASGDEKATITFFFSEEMDEDSLKNLSNYVVISGDTANNDKPFSAISGRDISIKEIKDGGKSIVIYYKDADTYFNANSTNYFKLQGLKDKAGNYATTTNVQKYATTTMNLDTGRADGAVVATAKNKVEVYFTTDVKEADPSAFVVKVGAEKIYFNDYKIDGKKVVLTLSKDLPTTAAANYKLAVEITEIIKDVYGNKFSAAKDTEYAITDKIKPYVKEIKEVAGQKLEISVSEVVYAQDLSGLLDSMIVRDKDGNIVTATDTRDAATWDKGADANKNKVLVKVYRDSTNNPATYTGGFNLIVLTYGNDFQYKNVTVEFINRTVKDVVNNVIESYEKAEKTIKVD